LPPSVRRKGTSAPLWPAALLALAAAALFVLAPGPARALTYKTYYVRHVMGYEVLCEIYKVQPGDNLAEIFRLRGQLVERAFPEYLRFFRKLNPHIRNADVIYPGQGLLLPLKKLDPGTLPEQASGKISLPIVAISDMGLGGTGPRKPPEPDEPWIPYKVKPGDTVTTIIGRYFGGMYSDEYWKALKDFRRLNPLISNLDRIYIGEVLRLPEIPGGPTPEMLVEQEEPGAKEEAGPDQAQARAPGAIPVKSPATKKPRDVKMRAVVMEPVPGEGQEKEQAPAPSMHGPAMAMSPAPTAAETAALPGGASPQAAPGPERETAKRTRGPSEEGLKAPEAARPAPGEDEALAVVLPERTPPVGRAKPGEEPTEKPEQGEPFPRVATLQELMAAPESSAETPQAKPALAPEKPAKDEAVGQEPSALPLLAGPALDEQPKGERESWEDRLSEESLTQEVEVPSATELLARQREAEKRLSQAGDLQEEAGMGPAPEEEPERPWLPIPDFLLPEKPPAPPAGLLAQAEEEEPADAEAAGEEGEEQSRDQAGEEAGEEKAQATDEPGETGLPGGAQAAAEPAELTETTGPVVGVSGLASQEEEEAETQAEEETGEEKLAAAEKPPAATLPPLPEEEPEPAVVPDTAGASIDALLPILSELGFSAMVTGEYFFPRETGPDFKLSLAHHPVVRSPRGNKIVLSSQADTLTPENLAVISRYWGTVKPVVVPETTPRAVLEALLDAAGFSTKTSSVSLPPGRTASTVRADYILDIPQGPRLAISWISDESQATHPAMVRFFANQGIRILDLLPSGEPPPMDKGLLVPECPSFDHGDCAELTAKLMETLEIPYAQNVPVSFPLAGFKVRTRSNVARTPDGTDYLVDFGAIGGKGAQVLKRIGLNLIQVQPGPAMEVVRTVAEGLSSQVQPNPVFFTASREWNSVSTMRVPGLLIIRKGRPPALVAQGTIPKEVACFLADKGIRMLAVSAQGCP